MSDLLVLVHPTSPAASTSSCCKGRCWKAVCWWLLSKRTFQLVRRRYMVLFLHKIKGTVVWEGGGTSPRTGAMQYSRGKSMLHPSSAACTQGSQQLKGHKIYLLSVCLFLVYLIKKASLVCHLLPGLFEIQKEPCTASLMLPPLSPGAEHFHNVC